MADNTCCDALGYACVLHRTDSCFTNKMEHILIVEPNFNNRGWRPRGDSKPCYSLRYRETYENALPAATHNPI